MTRYKAKTENFMLSLPFALCGALYCVQNGDFGGLDYVLARSYALFIPQPEFRYRCLLTV